MNRATDDLISRKQAIKEILAFCPEETKPGSLDEYGVTVLSGIVDVILKQLPAVDVAPVVHGWWIDIPDKPEWDQKMCSVCGDYFCCQNNYCPNCGAKMETKNE